MKATVEYAVIVKGKYGPQLVKEGSVPTIDEEGNETYDYSAEPRILDRVERIEGNACTIIVIDGTEVSEGLVWKAIGTMLGR
jgi:hypothetical protein